MNLIGILKERGLINNVTDEKKVADIIKQKKGIYVGFDPSFSSLHLGNYLMIRLLNFFADNGFPTFAIIGGATGQIGDPSGKKNERSLLTKEVLDKNIIALTKQLKKLTKATIINNYVIYEKMSLFAFLRNVGKLINVNYLLEKEIIKNRLATGISYAEFSYNLIQGYDFLWLYKNKQVALQFGGSDQWGNITTGLEMIRKDCGENALAGGIVINLFTKADGTKFGKSEKGAIYLDADISSPYEMYQFLLNQQDVDLQKLFLFFTDLSKNDIVTILNQHEQCKQKRFGQKSLAKEIITKIHGQEAYQQCLKIAEALFYGRFDNLTLNELFICTKQVNVFKINKKQKLVDFLLNSKILSSKRLFREHIENKVIQVNNNLVTDENYYLSPTDAYFKKYTILKKGKKNYYILEWI